MTQFEFFDKYGNVMVKFLYYYKYTFHFEGMLEDGSEILVRVGGISDEIYRFEVIANREVSVEDLYPFNGEVIKDGKKVEEFYAD